MRKKQSTAVRHPSKPDTVRVFLKGAPEIVLEDCNKFFNNEGVVVELGENKK